MTPLFGSRSAPGRCFMTAPGMLRDGDLAVVLPKWHSPFLTCAVLAQLTLVGASAAVMQSSQEAPNRLPLSVKSLPELTVRLPPKSTQWEGREYDIETGIDVLMAVIRDDAENAERRSLALIDLAHLRTSLRGRECMSELAKLYDGATDSVKYGILICFKGSNDPRGIGVLVSALDKDQNTKLRLSAAAGLAQWNVRAGVAELVRLLDSDDEMPQPSHEFYVRDNALQLFRTKNRLKGWGFPDAEIAEAVMGKPNLSDKERAALFFIEYSSAIKKWWAENQDRFPDWKLGNPLPAIDATDGEPENAPAEPK